MRSIVAKKDKKAVIWVSTVLYTLIGLTIIGMLLAVVRPKLAEMKDHLTITQTIDTFHSFDNTINDIKKGTGSRKGFGLKLGKGEFTISGADDLIQWELKESSYGFEEGTVSGAAGERLDVTTIKKDNKKYGIILRMGYTDTNLTFNGADTERVLQPASTPYNLQLENKGAPGTPETGRGKQQIDIQLS